MILKKQYRILQVFARESWKSFQFKEIKKLAGISSDNYVHTTLKKLVEEEFLQETKVGKTILYSIKPSSSALNMFGFILENKTTQVSLPNKNLEIIMNLLKTSFYILLITGSYASQKQTKKSDIDVVLIVDDAKKPEYIISQIMTECEIQHPPIHPYVFTESQFVDMLISEEENYGKEIIKNNLVVVSGKEYLSIIEGAKKHGLFS